MKPQTWAVVAAFFEDENARWIDDFVVVLDVNFVKIIRKNRAKNWHSGKSRTTRVSVWLKHLRQAYAAYRVKPDGIVTAFPQLAMCTALLRKPVIIAYRFNLGGFLGGVKQKLARWLSKEVSMFVVHSPSEIEPYAASLGVSVDQIRFVPIQRGALSLPREEDTSAPFILAMGSAQRDYETLIKSVDALGIATKIVTRKNDIAKLPQSQHVAFLSDMTLDECTKLLARARLSVTPVSNLETASGQVTFVTAMRLGVPVIVTKCPGSDGYLRDKDTGYLVEPFNEERMTSAISALWGNETLRSTLAESGRLEAELRFSDEADAIELEQIIV